MTKQKQRLTMRQELSLRREAVDYEILRQYDKRDVIVQISDGHCYIGKADKIGNRFLYLTNRIIFRYGDLNNLRRDLEEIYSRHFDVPAEGYFGPSAEQGHNLWRDINGFFTEFCELGQDITIALSTIEQIALLGSSRGDELIIMAKNNPEEGGLKSK